MESSTPQPERKELAAAMSSARLNRRDLLRRGLALGLSVPAVAGLLAA